MQAKILAISIIYLLIAVCEKIKSKNIATECLKQQIRVNINKQIVSKL